MKRRDFLKRSALTATWLASDQVASANPENFVLENSSLAWHLEQRPDGIRSTSFENRLSGRHYQLQAADEFALVFSQGQRIEIPWWNFQLTDAEDIPPERESGLARGFQNSPSPPGAWRPVNNLVGLQKQ